MRKRKADICLYDALKNKYHSIRNKGKFDDTKEVNRSGTVNEGKIIQWTICWKISRISENNCARELQKLIVYMKNHFQPSNIIKLKIIKFCDVEEHLFLEIYLN
jgi:hypothetical protein